MDIILIGWIERARARASVKVYEPFQEFMQIYDMFTTLTGTSDSKKKEE